MAGNYLEAKNKETLYRRLKKKSNKVFIDRAGPTLQKRARKGFSIYYVIIDKKRKSR